MGHQSTHLCSTPEAVSLGPVILIWIMGYTPVSIKSFFYPLNCSDTGGARWTSCTRRTTWHCYNSGSTTHCHCTGRMHTRTHTRARAQTQVHAYLGFVLSRSAPQSTMSTRLQSSTFYLVISIVHNYTCLPVCKMYKNVFE